MMGDSAITAGVLALVGLALLIALRRVFGSVNIGIR